MFFAVEERKPTYDDIRVMHDTGRKAEGSSYRVGKMTKLGDIEEAEWVGMAERLIKKNGEWELFEKLKEWYKDTVKWFRGEKELHIYSLECFVARIFDNPEWVDYADFNEKYRSEVLDKERGGEGMISNKKALKCAETLVKFCGEQKSCQNCIFRKHGCDRWRCHIEAIDLKYAIDEVKEHIEAKKRNGGYL